MLETLLFLSLGACHLVADHLESKEARRQAEREQKEDELVELKTKVFRYALIVGRSYNDVVKDLENGVISFDDIDKVLKEDK